METRESTARPLGVIGCLTAGFELVSRQLWLVILPVLLDLLLWAGPRVSIEPLLNEFIDIISLQAAAEPDLSSQVQVVSDMLVQLGEKFNLLSLLGGIPVLTVPSLLAAHPVAAAWPLGKSTVWPVESIVSLVGWWILLVPTGLVLGFVYLYSVANQVRNGEVDLDLDVDLDSAPPSPEDNPSSEDAPDVPVAQRPFSATFLGKLVWYIAFAAVVLLVQIIVIPIAMLLVSMIATIVPVVGVIIWLFGIGMATYILLQLVFVIHGVLLGERNLLRAIWESFLLVRTQFWSVMGLLLLILVVYQGLGQLWAIPQADSWALLIGILANACVATGLVAATFIFYRERVEFIPQPRWPSRRAKTE